MEFNDLPLMLSSGVVKQITGLGYRRLHELEEIGVLENVPVNKRKRKYTRESIRNLLKLGPEGAMVKVN